MYRPPFIDNRFSFSSEECLNLTLLRLRSALALPRVVGGGAPD